MIDYLDGTHDCPYKELLRIILNGDGYVDDEMGVVDVRFDPSREQEALMRTFRSRDDGLVPPADA